MATAISVENLAKTYQLGVIGTGTFRGDVQRWWARMRGRPDPLLRVGETDHGNRIGEIIWALKDISFDIRQGEAIGIIGRNGAGKSTLLKILSRVTAPTSGLVKVKGRIASLLEVGTGFHPELTGRENIYLNGTILGMSRDEVKRKFDQIVDFSGVEQFIDTPVKRYSSGMYVRLAFSVAAHLDPDILVVDEVLAVGDLDFQKKCLGKMDDSVNREGRTVLLVSHGLQSIANLCSKCFLFDQGYLIRQGKPEDVIQFYTGLSLQKGEIYHQTNKKLSWGGLQDRDALDQLSPKSDICFKFLFRSGQEELKKCHIDILLKNSRGDNVIHSKSKFVSKGIDIPPSAEVIVEYVIHSPQLAPGNYFLTVYVYTDSEVLFWAENVDACTISTKPFFGIADYYDEIKSCVFPKYQVNYSVKDSRS